MNPIDQSIEQLERLYERLTGVELKKDQIKYQLNKEEVDPTIVVDQRLHALIGLVHDPVVEQFLQPWSPAYSAWEGNDKILICFDIAGVRKEDVDINIQGGSLIVTGQRRMGAHSGEMQMRRLGLPYGPFSCSIPLPNGVTTAQLHSNIRDGVLEVAIPRKAAKTNGKAKKSKTGSIQ